MCACNYAATSSNLTSEQSEKSPQLPTQSTGHAPSSQPSDSTSVAGHAAPPFADSVTTEYERVRVPAPHDAEHVVHASQAPSQSCVSTFAEQACVLQGMLCGESAGQATPPLPDAVCTAYVRSRVPPPQVCGKGL